MESYQYKPYYKPGNEPKNYNIGEFKCIYHKTSLVNPNPDEWALWKRKLNGLLEESGEVLYQVGSGSCQSGDFIGLPLSDLEKATENLKKLATECNAECQRMDEIWTENRLSTVHYLVRKYTTANKFAEIKIAAIGTVDAGKSTLLGVLTRCKMDNGNGVARKALFRHKHEYNTGRTSSVGMEILGFDSAGKMVNDRFSHGSVQWPDLCKESFKVLTFIDLAGHGRYMKTTAFGLLGGPLHFIMIVVGSNAGLVKMIKEHLALALITNVPLFVVITKIDACSERILKRTRDLLSRLMRSQDIRKKPIVVRNINDAILCAKAIVSDRICPVFSVSNVTGENIGLLRAFLNLLPLKNVYDENDLAEFQIEEVYNIPNVGTVVGGTMLQGKISANDSLLLGPTDIGSFLPVTIKSIERKKLPVNEVAASNTATFSLKNEKEGVVRRGMVLVSEKVTPLASIEFQAQVTILHNNITMNTLFHATVHCGSIRQTAYVLKVPKFNLRSGDKGVINMRFIDHPEYMKAGSMVILRDRRVKAFGHVVRMIPPHELTKEILSFRGEASAAKFEALRAAHSENAAMIENIMREFIRNDEKYTIPFDCIYKKEINMKREAVYLEALAKGENPEPPVMEEIEEIDSDNVEYGSLLARVGQPIRNGDPTYGMVRRFTSPEAARLVPKKKKKAVCSSASKGNKENSPSNEQGPNNQPRLSRQDAFQQQKIGARRHERATKVESKMDSMALLQEHKVKNIERQSKRFRYAIPLMTREGMERREVLKPEENHLLFSELPKSTSEEKR